MSIFTPKLVYGYNYSKGLKIVKPLKAKHKLMCPVSSQNGLQCKGSMNTIRWAKYLRKHVFLISVKIRHFVICVTCFICNICAMYDNAASSDFLKWTFMTYCMPIVIYNEIQQIIHTKKKTKCKCICKITRRYLTVPHERACFQCFNIFFSKLVIVVFLMGY